MLNVHYPEIDEAITYIHNHIYDPLSLEALAKHVSYSPYHFSRIFKERMGISPLYYVSSVKLQKAKHLLLHTNLSIRDICEEIGQQSLGTFTTRFSEKVGIAPSAFRHSTPQAYRHLEALRNVNQRHFNPSFIHRNQAIVEGWVNAVIPYEGVVFIGLFPKPIPEGIPLYGTLLTDQAYYCIPNVQPGTYYLMATTVSWGMQANDILLPTQTLRTRSRKPIEVEAGNIITEQVHLYSPRIDDPPILISLPILMKQYIYNIQHAD